MANDFKLISLHCKHIVENSYDTTEYWCNQSLAPRESHLNAIKELFEILAIFIFEWEIFDFWKNFAYNVNNFNKQITTIIIRVSNQITLVLHYRIPNTTVQHKYDVKMKIISFRHLNSRTIELTAWTKVIYLCA